jgi:hypothetical protein
MKKLLIFALFAGLLAGCYYDNEETLYPTLDKGCDTTGVTYSKSIVPIFQTNCLSCHSSKDYASTGGNINLEDFNMVQLLALQGILFGAVTHNSNNSPMPKNGAKIDTCSITKIKIWIDHGALNN